MNCTASSSFTKATNPSSWRRGPGHRNAAKGNDMADQPDKLKLGKGASFFVKTQLRRLRQEDDTWEADFFPIPCSDSKHDSVWWGIVLSHSHANVVAQHMVDEPPTVNDLAHLLAEAMRRPL